MAVLQALFHLDDDCVLRGQLASSAGGVMCPISRVKNRHSGICRVCLGCLRPELESRMKPSLNLMPDVVKMTRSMYCMIAMGKAGVAGVTPGEAHCKIHEGRIQSNLFVAFVH